ncbi:MAG: YceI family protein [Candidatus Binataceae bacterium]
MKRLVAYVSTVTLISLTLGLFCGAALAHTLILKVDTKASTITATVDKPLARMTGNVSVKFDITHGEVRGDPVSPAASGHVNIVIDATSIDSGSDHLDRKLMHSSLQTYDYQAITFDSTGIKDAEIESAGAVGKAIVVGNLTLHGTTRQISMPVSVSLSPQGVFYADGSTRFNYTEFGVKVPSFMGIPEAAKVVTIEFHVVARPLAPAHTN